MTVKNKGRNDGGILMSQKNVFYENKKEKAAKSSHLQTDLTVFYPPPHSLSFSPSHTSLVPLACETTKGRVSEGAAPLWVPPGADAAGN